MSLWKDLPRLCLPSALDFESAAENACKTFTGAVMWWLGVWELASDYGGAGISCPDKVLGQLMENEADEWCTRCQQALKALKAADPVEYEAAIQSIANTADSCWAYDWADAGR